MGMGVVARIVVLVLALAAALPAAAEGRFALVFSAQDYQQLRPLANPAADAALVARTLSALGFTVSIETDRTLKKMRRALDDFRKEAAGADLALVYFAGHGVEIAGENLLLPVDADASSLDRLKDSALPLEEVRSAAAAVAGSVIIVLDACRDDPFGAGSGGGRSARPLGADVVAAAHPGLGRIGRAEHTLFAFAAAPGETASDGADGHSPFTAAFTRYLATDGLEIRSVLTLVQQAVYDATGGRQLPYVESGLPSLFFAARTGDLPERERLLLAMADVTPALRAEVERIATDREMPLAPLYAALIGADLTSMGAEARAEKLAEAADAFVTTRERLKTLAADDPKVAALRGEAEKALSLGAFATARARLAEAAAIDAGSRQALKANYVARTVSEADSHRLSGGVARATLAYRDAIAAWRKAAVLYAEVAEDDLSDDTRANLLWMLADLGDVERIDGDIGAALDAYRAMLGAATLRRERFPHSADAERDIAAAQSRLGTALRKNGQLAPALEAFRAALAIAQGAAAARPDDSAAQDDLAIAWNKLGDALADFGDLAGATRAYGEDAAISGRLAASAPGDANLQRNHAVALERQAGVQAIAGDTAAALATGGRALALRRALVARAPDSVEDRRGLAISLGDLAEWQIASGDFDRAIAGRDEAVTLLAGLVEQDPGNAPLARDLALATLRLGSAYLAAGDGERAGAALREAIRRFDTLVERDPGNAELARDASIALARLADLDLAIGEIEPAAAAIGRVIAIRERLVAADPADSNMARDLSLAHGRLYDVMKARKDGDGMISSSGASLAIAERLAAGDPANRLWQRDLSVALIRSGDALRLTGGRKAAQKPYRRALEIRQTLAGAAPGDVEAARDLLVAHTRLAEIGVDARTHLRAALAVAEALAASGALRGADVQMPNLIRKRLAEL